MKKQTINGRLRELGFSELRPTEQALGDMKISKRRLTTILEKKNKTPITVTELQNITAWIHRTNKLGEEDLASLVI